MQLPIKIPREEKTLLVEDLQKHLEDTLGEEVGNLAAESVLDFVLGQVAPYVHNQAVGKARKLVSQQMERLDEELSFLEQPLKRRR